LSFKLGTERLGGDRPQTSPHHSPYNQFNELQP
jgi:hypothetical protein